MTRVRRCPPCRAVAENAYVYKRAVKRSLHQKLRGTTRLRTTASAGATPTKTSPAGWILVLGPELKRLPSLRGVATLAFGLASPSTSGVREQQSNMSERNNDTTAADPIREQPIDYLDQGGRQCAGVSHLCATPGCHTAPREKTEKKVSIAGSHRGYVLCAGCATPRRYYRVTCVCVRPHTRRGECSALTQHTQHTPISGSRKRQPGGSRGRSPLVKCDTGGQHTRPPGVTHLGNMIVSAPGGER